MKKTITINDMREVDHGTNDNTAWTLWEVIDGDGKRYATFLDDLEPGETVCVEIVEREGKMNPKTGKPYRNFTIVGRAIPEGEQAARPEGKEDVMKACREIYKAIKALEAKFDKVLEKAAAREDIGAEVQLDPPLDGQPWKDRPMKFGKQ